MTEDKEEELVSAETKPCYWPRISDGQYFSFEVKAKDNGNTGSDLETIENERTAEYCCRVLVWFCANNYAS